jgi:hypothetical protein
MVLAETGFELKKVTADFTDRPPSTESERLFFTAGRYIVSEEAISGVTEYAIKYFSAPIAKNAF